MKLDIKVIPLAKIPHLYDELLNLIEDTFHYSNENKFELDFLPLVHPSNWENCFLIFHENLLIGHIGFVKKNLAYKNENLICAFIGGVCIKKDFQGKGFFQESMKHIIEKIKDVALIFLWSGHESGYKKFNFHETGRVFQTGNEKIISLPEFKKSKIHHLTSEEKKLVMSSYVRTTSRLISPVRSNQDWEIIFQMSSIDIFHSLDLNNFSYFLVNKGQDLTDVIHEYGAMKLDTEKNLIKKLTPYKFWSPTELNSRSESILFLANIRIQNRPLFIQWLKNINFEIDMQLNDEELLTTVFNSKKLSFYIPGCDSI